MTFDGNLHERRSIRLQGWDYASDGTYFVTLCTQARVHLFGEVRDGQMYVNQLGTVVADAWQWLASQYSYVTLDEWCIMPNHLHGILVLRRGGSRTAPTATGDATTATIKPVGRLVGAFKTVSTKQTNLVRQTPGGIVWQRDFWDRVVRDDDEMNRIRLYIRQNPASWAIDPLNPCPPDTA